MHTQNGRKMFGPNLESIWANNLVSIILSPRHFYAGLIHKIAEDDEEDDDDDEDDDENNQKKVESVKLDDDNRPILPKLSDQSLEDRKKIIREYITLAYSESSSKIRVQCRANQVQDTSHPIQELSCPGRISVQITKCT